MKKIYFQFLNKINLYKAQYGRGTTWLWIYVFIRMPLSIIISAITSGSDLLTLTKTYSSTTTGILMINIASLAFHIYVFAKLVVLNKSAYTLNVITLCIDTIMPAFLMAINSNAEYLSAYFIGAVLPTILIWFWPNFIYFKKRKSIFE